MLELAALLRAAGIPLSTESGQVKVHLAVFNLVEHPLDVFNEGRFPEWQEDQARKNFECEQVLSLIALGDKRWLFAGLFERRSVKVHPHNRQRFIYDLKELPGQKDLIGRIIVRWDRKGARNSYRWLESMGSIGVESYSSEKVPFQEFPGWGRPWSLRWTDLIAISTNSIEDWQMRLSDVKGVYLITDQCDKDCRGKQYVGIASGSKGIWGRWSDYAKTGHGGNIKLKALLNKRGPDHARSFLYTILETAPTTASVAYLTEREQYWMHVLGSKANGLNS
jgi:hypothetical protein